MCIFDATEGSLRLTERLADCSGDILEEAIVFACRQKDAAAVHELEAFAGFVADLREQSLEDAREIERVDANLLFKLVSGLGNASKTVPTPIE